MDTIATVKEAIERRVIRVTVGATDEWLADEDSEEDGLQKAEMRSTDALRALADYADEKEYVITDIHLKEFNLVQSLLYEVTAGVVSAAEAEWE